MKYKVGDEVLVKARIVEVNAVKAMPYTIVREKNVGYTSNSMLVKALDIVQKPDMTAEEAWEITKKILFIPLLGGIEDVDLQGIFGTCNIIEIMKNNSPKEAKAKIEAWEAEKEIKVGDVVIETSVLGSKYIGVVTQITDNQNSVCMTYSDGSVGVTIAKRLKKTGRHIDIDGLLKQIGGDE